MKPAIQRPRNVAAFLGRPQPVRPAVSAPTAKVPPASFPEKPKATLPADTPCLPEGRILGDIGLIVWTKLCKTLQTKGSWSDDYKEALYTLCSLEECAAELRNEFLTELTVESRGGRKINPVVGEWTKMVTLLRAYYSEFALTPKSAQAPSTPTGTPKTPPVGSRRTNDGPNGPKGLFDDAE